MFWVRDLAASLLFYRDGLGFAVDRQWIDEGRLRWCWMTRDSAALMLQEAGREGPRHGRHDETTATVIVHFICRDAIGAWRELLARGVAAKRPFVGNAMWVTEVVDPDGHRLVFESPTDAAEESEYAGPEGEPA
jgi:catechol 2,3-dioxygenase-like lactoylglutathione lyase family enzyme